MYSVLTDVLVEAHSGRYGVVSLRDKPTSAHVEYVLHTEYGVHTVTVLVVLGRGPVRE